MSPKVTRNNDIACTTRAPVRVRTRKTVDPSGHNAQLVHASNLAYRAYTGGRDLLRYKRRAQVRWHFAQEALHALLILRR
jgi:hypothetical protein